MNKREKQIFEGLCNALADMDDPLVLAEEWAEEVAKIKAENERLREVLAGLSSRHEGYEQACGPCICTWHEKAREILKTSL